MGPIFDGSPLFDLAKYEKNPFLFHEFVHKGLTNSRCSKLKLFTLNYHIQRDTLTYVRSMLFQS